MERRLVYGLLALVLLLSIPTVFADDEFEEEEEMSERIQGFESEEEDEGRDVGGAASIILYITIAAVAGTGGYVLWKITSMKTKVNRA